MRSDIGLGTAATTDNGTGSGQNIINTAVGGVVGNISYAGTLLNNTTGSSNTAIGSFTLTTNTAGGGNTATGRSALQNNTTGEHNTATGMYALLNNTTGNKNTAIGTQALSSNTKYDNCGGFGDNSQVTASNQIQLGNGATTVYAYGAVQNRSDVRDKAEVRGTVLGLDFINAIRPVDFNGICEDYRTEREEDATEEQREANKLANITADGTHTRKRYHHGVIAQEVAAVIDTLGVDFGGFQDHSKTGGDDVLSIGYEEFIAPLIKAVQELSARVKELESKD